MLIPTSHQLSAVPLPNPAKQNAGIGGAPPLAEGKSVPATGQEAESEAVKKKRGRPTSYSKLGGGRIGATTEEIKEATRTTRMERKRFQEKRRRKEFREALESLLASLVRQDKDFAKESQIREARMHGHAQVRPVTDDNMVFTRVEMVNQSIYTIERLTLEGQELRRTLADLGGGREVLRKLGHHESDSIRGGQPGVVFHHGVGPLASDSVPTTPVMPTAAVDTNTQLLDFQKRAQEPYYPSIMFQQQQYQLQLQQQHAMMMHQAQLQQAQHLDEKQIQQQQVQQQLLMQQAQQTQAMLMRGSLTGATTSGFGGVASPDLAVVGQQDIHNGVLPGLGRSTHMENAATMLMWQQQQEIMLSEQRKTLLLEQHKRQNPQASIGDLQSFLSSEYSTPNVPNAEGLLPDYNASSFMSALAAGTNISSGSFAPSRIPSRPSADATGGLPSAGSPNQAENQPGPISVDELVQPPADGANGGANGGATQEPRGFLARLQAAGGALPSTNTNGWQNGQPSNGTRET